MAKNPKHIDVVSLGDAHRGQAAADEEDDVALAVLLLGLDDDLRPVADGVAREICRRACAQADAQLDKSKQPSTRAHVRDKLEAVAKHTKVLRKELESLTVLEPLAQTSFSPPRQKSRSKADEALAEIPRLLAQLPSDLYHLEVATQVTIDTLKLSGKAGSDKADATYRPTPRMYFTRCAMDLWKVAKGAKRAPSEGNVNFVGFLNALGAAVTPQWDKQDWARTIQAARGAGSSKSHSAAYQLARWEARRIVKPLINAIRPKKRD